MATYIALLNLTDKGIRSIKDSPDRLDAVKALAKSMGGGLKAFYLVMGAYDGVVILEAPSDEVCAKIALAAGAAGNIKTMTMRAFDEGEYRKIIAELP